MAYSSYVGEFNIDSSVTAGNDQSVTGTGFEPKIVMFWWSGSTATSDTVAGGTISFGFGAATSSTSRYCAVGVSEDAVDDSDTISRMQTSECIRIYTDTATTDGIADFSTMDSNGFTLTIDDQFTSDYRISYLALGGSDLTNVYIGDFTWPGSTGEFSESGVGFEPDALLISSVGNTSLPGGFSGYFSLGMATGSSNQGVAALSFPDNVGTTNTAAYGYSGECTASAQTYGMTHRGSFVSFGADGFTIDNLESTNAVQHCYICLKGGQYSVGDVTTRTDSNDISETVGFEPAAILFSSVNRAESTQDTRTDHARISIGAGTSTTNRSVQATSDEDALDISETAYTNQGDAVYAHVVDDAIEALMDIKSIDASGFTCVMDDTETSACWVNYLAIGATAGDIDIDIGADEAAYQGTGVRIRTP
jgi:hypothetical protein